MPSKYEDTLDWGTQAEKGKGEQRGERPAPSAGNRLQFSSLPCPAILDSREVTARWSLRASHFFPLCFYDAMALPPSQLL